MWHGHFGMFPFLGGGWSLIILVLAVWLIFRGSLGSCHYPGTHNFTSAPKGEDALETLKRRYAKGEISKAEYEEMRETLKS